MIHHTLANRGVTPEEVIFPVSASMLNHVHEYDACLESSTMNSWKIPKTCLPRVYWLRE
jgi:hypothetical protein